MSLESYVHLASMPRPGAPLIFVFHGTGGDEYQFFELIQQMVPGAGIIAPRGDVSEFGANRFFKRTEAGVYDMDDLGRAVTKMAAFLRAHADGHPDAPVYGMGYSNGANILAAVMMAQPDLIARAALLHPLIPWDPEPVAGLAGREVLITAGRRDAICPWPLTERLINWFRDQKSSVRELIHDAGHELRAEEGDALRAFFGA